MGRPVRLNQFFTVSTMVIRHTGNEQGRGAWFTRWVQITQHGQLSFLLPTKPLKPDPRHQAIKNAEEAVAPVTQRQRAAEVTLSRPFALKRMYLCLPHYDLKGQAMEW